ncbi:MAG TPA: monovalent cation/H+ antiporter complex subunit F [Acetobacteraceae bacterium]|nr:monovalent cation/H+ antiporter complex subunit F [Acetobacteraceae bacterium]
MTAWTAATLALLASFVPIGIGCLRGDVMARFVAYQIGGLNAVLCIMLLAQGFGRPFLFDLALALAFLSLPSGLVFNHFLSRWIP